MKCVLEVPVTFKIKLIFIFKDVHVMVQITCLLTLEGLNPFMQRSAFVPLFQISHCRGFKMHRVADSLPYFSQIKSNKRYPDRAV